MPPGKQCRYSLTSPRLHVFRADTRVLAHTTVAIVPSRNVRQEVASTAIGIEWQRSQSLPRCSNHSREGVCANLSKRSQPKQVRRRHFSTTTSRPNEASTAHRSQTSRWEFTETLVAARQIRRRQSRRPTLGQVEHLFKLAHLAVRRYNAGGDSAAVAAVNFCMPSSAIG